MHPGSEPEIINCTECNLVGDLLLSPEDVPQTHQLVLECSKNTGICQSSLVASSEIFPEPPNHRKQRGCLVANVLSGNVATQLR